MGDNGRYYTFRAHRKTVYKFKIFIQTKNSILSINDDDNDDNKNGNSTNSSKPHNENNNIETTTTTQTDWV